MFANKKTSKEGNVPVITKGKEKLGENGEQIRTKSCGEKVPMEQSLQLTMSNFLSDLVDLSEGEEVMVQNQGKKKKNKKKKNHGSFSNSGLR